MSASQNELREFSVTEHYKALQRALFVSALAFVFCLIFSAIYVDEIYQILLEPLQSIQTKSYQRKLIFTGITEGFYTYCKLAIYSALFISIPIIATQLYAFVAPGLYEGEKKYVRMLLVLSSILFYCSIFVVYYYIMPITWNFFLSFENLAPKDGIPLIAELRVSEYLDLVLELMLGFGLAFQTPVVIVVLCGLDLISVKTLASIRKYVIVAAFIVGAMLTPPDVISQIALAIMLIILYEIAILLCKRIRKK